MNELSPALRRLVDRGAAALGPQPGDRDRLRGRILVAAGAAAGTSLVGGTAAAATAKAGGIAGAKLLVSLVTVGVLVAGSVALERALRHAPEPAMRSEPAPVLEPATEIDELDPVARPLEAAVVEDEPEPIIIVDPDQHLAPPSPVRQLDGELEPPALEIPPVDTLAAEMALLRAARRALAEQRAGAALEALDQHLRQFPDGELAPEAARVRVDALCVSSRMADAEAAAAALAERWPAVPAADSCWKGDR
jgi:hypothetical protein